MSVIDSLLSRMSFNDDDDIDEGYDDIEEGYDDMDMFVNIQKADSNI